MTTGQKIKEAREAKGLSQQAVADAAGITQAYLCQIETGVKDPFTRAEDLVERIAGALKVKAGKLRG
jgi:transcriptional regulator with XRE-family HTH domain